MTPLRKAIAVVHDLLLEHARIPEIDADELLHPIDVDIGFAATRPDRRDQADLVAEECKLSCCAPTRGFVHGAVPRSAAVTCGPGSPVLQCPIVDDLLRVLTLDRHRGCPIMTDANDEVSVRQNGRSVSVAI